MPSFPLDLAEPDVDFFLMRDGVVTLYWRKRLLDRALGRLRQMGYKVVEIDSAHSPDFSHFLATIGTALDFPTYYGRNLDALNDCLRDVATFDYGADIGSLGTVIAFRHYDRVVELDAHSAHAILDIFTDRARDGLLFGHRMMVLVHSDDPDISFAPLGAQAARWNADEEMDISRHPDRDPRNAAESCALGRLAMLEGRSGEEPGTSTMDR